MVSKLIGNALFGKNFSRNTRNLLRPQAIQEQLQIHRKLMHQTNHTGTFQANSIQMATLVDCITLKILTFL